MRVYVCMRERKWESVALWVVQGQGTSPEGSGFKGRIFTWSSSEESGSSAKSSAWGADRTSRSAACWKVFRVDRLRVGGLKRISSFTHHGSTHDKRMSRCHLPRVVYLQVYNVY